MIIEFGALCKPLSEQIEGINSVPDKLSDAITLLSVHGLLSEGETYKARKRLVKRIDSGRYDEEAKGIKS